MSVDTSASAGSKRTTGDLMPAVEAGVIKHADVTQLGDVFYRAGEVEHR